MSRHRRIRLLVAAAAVAVAGLGWLWLAPQELGGPATYVVTRGTSMQPGYRTGDLAILRAASRYRTGDVVGYRSRMLHTIVLHRIVGERDGRYVFKGDNNTWVDPELIAPADLLGRTWLHVPLAGRALGTVGDPYALAGEISVGLLLLLGGARTRRRRGSRSRRSKPRSSVSPRRLAAVAALLLVAGAAAVATSVGTARTATAASPAVRSGSFSYDAIVAPGLVYPSGRVHGGDPIFLRQVRRLRVRFGFTGDRPGGAITLTLLLDNGTGWTRAVPLRRHAAFAGTTATVEATVAVDRAVRLFKQVEAATGVRGPRETIGVRADVGTAGGGSFRSDALFTLDPARLELQPPATPAPSEQRLPAASGAHARLAIQRPLAAAGGGAALLCALAVAGVAALRRPRRGENPDERLRRRNGDRIVELSGSFRHGEPRATVSVASFGELLRLAESYERLILHEHDGREEAFAFTEDGVSYVFRRPAPACP
jgi:signal peptidase I